MVTPIDYLFGFDISAGMRKRVLVLVLGILMAFSMMQTVGAHVPLFMEGGHTLSEAVEIENPTKSWVIYSTIDEVANPHYFYFDMQAGQRIRLILNIPVPDGIRGFRPRLALMGNGLTNLSTAPAYLEIPSGAGVMILEPTTLIPEYEGFTPTSFHELYDLDIVAPTTGRYYLAYYEPSITGNFAVAIGYEEIYSLTEWVAVPITALVTHMWNYQTPASLLAPVLITVLVGLILLFWRYPHLRSKSQVLGWLGITAGLVFISSGVFIFYQMVLALLLVPVNSLVVATITFGILPIVLGVLTIRSCLFPDWTQQPRQLLYLFIFSVLALFFWSGWIVTPILLIITAVIPSIQLLIARWSSRTT